MDAGAARRARRPDEPCQSTLVRGIVRDRVSPPAWRATARSLGFVVETERQVEEHLTGHIDRLPAGDARSRAIVAAMRDDEVRHGMAAHVMRARASLPLPVRALMRVDRELMTLTAYRI